ncbi:MAG: 4-hydroxyphenylacetate decarboxylase activase [Clostridium sp.]
MEQKGLLFDIQAYSVHDGPGCRTNVFFVGCPLKCRWCANPESWVKKKHIMFAENVCKYDKGCRACKDSCPYGSIILNEDGKPSIHWELCMKCETFECTNSCPNNVFKQCVKEYTPQELITLLRRDFNSWGSEGGVTFTGGEPLLHHEFLIEVLKECQQWQIHTAIETSAYEKEEVFLEIFKYINFAFIDVKHMDSKEHRLGTGVGNKKIISNIIALKKSGWKGRLVLRQPTIGGYNDSDENARRVIRFMKENDLFEINLLKFHRLGTTKWNQMGKDYEYKNHGDISEERMKELQAMYLEENIACYIGEDTPF